MKWSEQTWERIQPIYRSIIQMPFIHELIDGTLSLDKFQFYLLQDSIYLQHFGRCLALLGARAHDVQDALVFMRFAQDAIIVENALHETYFKEFGISGSEPAQPACHHYVHFLKSTAALDAVEICMAAVLPCFWIYKEVGDYIYQQQKHIGNPYQRWIDTYAGEDFALLVENAIDICDRAAIATTKKVQDEMTEAFRLASQLEYDFWDGAYNFRTWQFNPMPD